MKTIVISSLEDYKNLRNINFEYKKNVIVNIINAVDIRMTDCQFSYDYMMETYQKALYSIDNLSLNEMFEVMICLSNKGIKNFYLHLFGKYVAVYDNVWEYRKLKKSLKYLYEKCK